MCGRFNLIDSPQVQLLCALLGVPLPTHNFRADIAPGGPIAIVLERRNAEGQKSRQVSEATWWLLLDPYKPGAKLQIRKFQLSLRQARFAAFGCLHAVSRNALHHSGKRLRGRIRR